ncbi:hypothetical protein N2152v2_006070 [Parachlorella kessleri]
MDSSLTPDDPQYPAGKSRLETLSVLGCAAIMTMGALQVVSECTQQLYHGFTKGLLPELDMTTLMYVILGAATILKLWLWGYCFTLRHASGAALALAEDHINDVVSNLGAIVTAAIASKYQQRFWWADPVGGIGISCYIMLRWAIITKRQVDKIVGRTAPPDFLGTVRELAGMHHPQMGVGFLRAYHCGQRLAVDVELTAPGGMVVAEAAQVARELKCKASRMIEALPEVECAAVFVVHEASGDFWPSQAPLIAPGATCKPRSAIADLDGLLDAFEDTRRESPRAVLALGLGSPRPGDAGVREGRTGAWPGQPGGQAGSAPASTFGGGGPAAALVLAGGVRRIRSMADTLPLLRSHGGSTPSLRQVLPTQPPEPPLARQLAWSRSLKDSPDRVLQSAALHASDTATMMLSKLARRSAAAGRLQPGTPVMGGSLSTSPV